MKEKVNCKHENIENIIIIETTEAYTTHWIQNNIIYHNNDFGNIFKIEVVCASCNKKWNITNNYERLPKSMLTKVIEFRKLYEEKQLENGDKIN